jgi:uncharacterized membrane protein
MCVKYFSSAVSLKAGAILNFVTENSQLLILIYSIIAGVITFISISDDLKLPFVFFLLFFVPGYSLIKIFNLPVTGFFEKLTLMLLISLAFVPGVNLTMYFVYGRVFINIFFTVSVTIFLILVSTILSIKPMRAEK